MRRCILLLLIIGSLILTTPVQAQTPAKLEIERMTTEIWPEFDRPDVLIIYRITLAANTDLPAQVSVRIPRESGQPYNVAFLDIDSLPYILDYKTIVEGEWLRVSFTAPTQGIQIEYYDPRLKRTQTKRDYEYRWMSDYKVKFMTVRVQQPLNVTSFIISPQMGTGRQETDGLTYYTNMLGSLSANVPMTIRLTYDKPDDTLSSTSLTVQPSQPINRQTPGRTSLQEALPWALLVVGVVLVTGGVLWYWRSRRKQPAEHRRHPPKSKETPTPASTTEVIYCSQCGKRAAPGDSFCRVCGTKLRYE